MAHSKKDISVADFTNYNSKPIHQHIPRIGQNPPLGEVVGGGKVECGICNLVLMDSST